MNRLIKLFSKWTYAQALQFKKNIIIHNFEFRSYLPNKVFFVNQIIFFSNTFYQFNKTFYAVKNADNLCRIKMCDSERESNSVDITWNFIWKSRDETNRIHWTKGSYLQNKERNRLSSIPFRHIYAALLRASPLRIYTHCVSVFVMLHKMLYTTLLMYRYECNKLKERKLSSSVDWCFSN